MCPRGLPWDPCCLYYYINSTLSITDARNTVRLYADDMKCYRVIDNGADAVQLQCTSLMVGHASEHFMKFNADKCKHLVMTKKKIYTQNLSEWQVAVISERSFFKLIMEQSY